MEAWTCGAYGADNMSILDRLLNPRTPKQQEDVDRLSEEYRESTRRLREKLDEDPCASDPTRERCGPDVADVLLATRRNRRRER